VQMKRIEKTSRVLPKTCAESSIYQNGYHRYVHPISAYQRVRSSPSSQINPADISVLQRAIGNHAVGRLLQAKKEGEATLQLQNSSCPECLLKEEGEMQSILQRQAEEEEEEMQPMLQRQVEEEEEEEMQLMLQRQAQEEEEEMQPMLQRRGERDVAHNDVEICEPIPGGLRTGVESLSGFDMSDVSVYRNSKKPAAVGALAYTQGTDIYVAPGQEKHLPHEAWHAVQQKEGRVQPNNHIGGVSMNDDANLEKEADRMGVALQAP